MPGPFSRSVVPTRTSIYIYNTYSLYNTNKKVAQWLECGSSFLELGSNPYEHVLLDFSCLHVCGEKLFLA
jgi:hypothetical protein